SLGSALGEHPAAAGSGFDGADGLEEIDVGGAAEEQSFADGEHVDDDEDLVHELGGLAGAAGAHVSNAGSDGVEDGFDALEVVFGAADHDAEGALGRAFAASGDGGVEEGDVLLGEGMGEVFGFGGADGAEIDDGGSAAEGFGEAGFAEEDGFDVGGVADTDEDGIAGFGEGLERGRDVYAEIVFEGFGFFGGSVPDGYGVIFFGEVFHHAASHDAEANESDLRGHGGSITG